MVAEYIETKSVVSPYEDLNLNCETNYDINMHIGNEFNVYVGADAPFSVNANSVTVGYAGSTVNFVVSYTSQFFDTIEMIKTVTTYNNITTKGIGFSTVYGATLQKAETGADSSVLSYTPPSTAGTYKLHVAISCSAATSATLGWTATWTDSNSYAQAPTNLAISTSGVAAHSLTVTAAANGAYYGVAIIDIDNSGTAIVIKTTFSGTSIAYNISAIIEQVA